MTQIKTQTNLKTVVVRKARTVAHKAHNHYFAIVALLAAVWAILWYLGFDEFRHSLAFLAFEHILRHSTAWAIALEE